MSYSIRETIILDGFLRGEDCESRCKIRAVKVSLPKLDVWEYVAGDVSQAPDDLPLGAYEVSFEGRKLKVHKTAQGWKSEQE